MAITLENANVIFDDGVNTDSMRNLGGGGVLAATFGQVAGLSLAYPTLEGENLSLSFTHSSDL